MSARFLAHPKRSQSARNGQVRRAVQDERLAHGSTRKSRVGIRQSHGGRLQLDRRSIGGIGADHRAYSNEGIACQRARSFAAGLGVSEGHNTIRMGGCASRKMREHMSDHYLEVISLIERLHRQFLEVVNLELDRLRVHDLNNVQALMLYNMGDADISVGELISRGYYLGSNVSYNVKKLSDSGYLTYQRSEHDRRSIRVRLTPKGRTLRGQLSDMVNRQIAMLGESRITDQDLQIAVIALQRLERFWMPPGVTT